MAETCSLDIADQVAERRRPLELAEVGALLGLSGESARLAAAGALLELERIL